MKVCGKPDCIELTESAYCEIHTPKPWAGRNGTTSRQARGVTLNGWQEQQRNQRILAKHHARCYLCGTPGCRQVDHVIPRMDGGPDTDSNLRPICDTCHTAKSKAEAARARAHRIQ